MGNWAVDSMNSCLVYCKLTTDELMKQIDLISSLFQSDLCDNLESYEKQYITQNKENLKRATEIWQKYSVDQSNMLNCRDDYY
jgi:hypothetical protein